MRGQLDERGLRLMAAAEARAAGYGGIAAVARATGIARSTIGRGLADLDQPALPPGQVRRAGSGRKPVQEKDPTLLADLRRLVEPATHGDPMRPLLWVSKSHAKLADALYAMGHPISPNTVGKLLREELGYSRQTNRKTLEGARHPDRDSQFAHINARACTFREAGQPVISVDTKKKELIGTFKNGGTDYRPKGSPEAVNVHDFEDKTLGKVAPYGVYDPVDNRGWVSLGIDHDTAEFAVNAIRTWHERIGRERYRGSDADDHGRLRRLQWSAGAAVESRAAEAGRRDRPDDLGLPLSARHLEVEQDRAPPVLPHHAELARPAAHQPCGRRRADRRDHDDKRADGGLRARPAALREGHQGERPGDGMPQHQRRRVPS